MFEPTDNSPINLDDALDEDELEATVALNVSDAEENNLGNETIGNDSPDEHMFKYCLSTTSAFDTLNMFEKTTVLITTEEQFMEKISECMTIYDFSADSGTDLEGKMQKEQALNLLANYAENADEPFTEKMHERVIAMFKANCIRVFNFPCTASDFGFVVKSIRVLDPAWVHLQLVYDFVLGFIESDNFQVEIAAQYIDQKFVTQLLALFDSKNVQEREALTMMLHQIYAKFVPLRFFIRQQIANIFTAFVYDAEENNGIAELLNFFGCVIDGFATPLKGEHLNFLQRVLMPLHKVTLLSTYQPNLIHCIKEFVKKDPALVEMIIKSLLKYWPHANFGQELLFLNELDEFFDIFDATEIKKLIIPIFKKLAYCTASTHIQVAERALVFWISAEFLKFVEENIADALPILLPPLQEKTTHSDASISLWASEALKKLAAYDQELYDSCMENFAKKEQFEVEREEKRKKVWEAIEQQAKCNAKAINFAD